MFNRMLKLILIYFGKLAKELHLLFVKNQILYLEAYNDVDDGSFLKNFEKLIKNLNEKKNFKDKIIIG